ncbi:MAG: Rieske (2Fe-2S) protein [Sphingobacteriales bacterium]|nr:MAG: Rieske (2Fe-2S) protein [Sphingobacteriales bacterium]
MQRRSFIKTGCSLCLLTAAGMLLPTVSSMAMAKTKPFKATINDQHQAEVPVALFEETTLQIVRVKGTFYDIALHKEEDGSYKAFLMRCTHMDNQLQLTGDGFRCSLHGSEYDKTGAVTKGPAEMPMVTYATTVNNDLILINIPNNEE